jgi:hypothetical protein
MAQQAPAADPAMSSVLYFGRQWRGAEVHRYAMTRLTCLISVWLVTLLGNGCASLRPPADDREVWLQQQQEAARASDNPDKSANLLLPLLSGLTTLVH